MSEGKIVQERRMEGRRQGREVNSDVGDDEDDNNGGRGKGGGCQILASAEADGLVKIWMRCKEGGGGGGKAG